MSKSYSSVNWYMRNQYSEEEIERYCIMTVDGCVDDDQAEKFIREMKAERYRAKLGQQIKKLATVASSSL